METFSLHIYSPCSQSWNKMTTADQGRYCDVCNLVVIDFTTMTEEEIKRYFLNSCGKKICGRFKKSQLRSSGNLRDKLRTGLIMLLSALGLMALASSCESKRDPGLMGDTIMIPDSMQDKNAELK